MRLILGGILGRFTVILLVLCILASFFYFWSWKSMVAPEDDAKRYLHETYAFLDHGKLFSQWASPGYPLFIAFVFLVAGRDNFPALLVSHLILRILTFLLASLLVLKVTKSRLYAFCSLMLLWSPAFMSQTRYIYTETLSAFLAMSAVYAYYLSMKNERFVCKILLWLLSSICGSWLALTRPVYQALIPIWWICELLRYRKFIDSWHYLTKLTLFWLFPSIIIVGGWSLRNYIVNGFFGLDALAGFQLCTKTVAVLERLPDDYAIERDILIWARDKELIEPHQGHKGYLSYGHAIPYLQAATGLSIPELSKRLLRMNLQLILIAPLNYIYEVMTSFATMWLPNVSPEEAFGRTGQAVFSLLNFIVHLTYLGVISILIACWILFGNLEQAAKILFNNNKGYYILLINKQIAVVVLYTTFVSAIVHVGQPRFLVPVEPLIVTSVVSMIYFVIHVRYSFLSTSN